MQTQKMQKSLTSKNFQQRLKKQQLLGSQKNFPLGAVTFANSDKCKASLVNFFGDIHTQVFSLKVNPSEKYVGVGCSNGSAKIYDIYEGKLLKIIHTSKRGTFPCSSFKWKPITQLQYVTCNCDGTMRWYDWERQNSIDQLNEPSGILCCDYQGFQDWIVYGTDQNSITIVDNQTKKPITTYGEQSAAEYQFNRVFCVKCIHNDTNVFISGGWDSIVHIWDIRVGRTSVRKFAGPQISSDSLDYKNEKILAGNYRNKEIAQLYDFKSGKLIENLEINEEQYSKSYCFSASFSQKSSYDLMAIALSGGNCVKILKDNTLVNQIKFKAPPLSLDFCTFNNKDYLLIGGIEGAVYVISLRFY